MCSSRSSGVPARLTRCRSSRPTHDIDLKKSYFYADGDEDVALMYLVGNPRPTNPEGKLAAVAAKRGWPILRFSSRSGSSPVSALRTLAGVASMAPVAAGAIGVGLLAGSKRRGVNFFTSNWGQLLLAATGVNLNVHRRGQPDRTAACGVHLQSPKPGGPGDRRRTCPRQLHVRGQEGTGEEPHHGHSRQGDGRGRSSTAKTQRLQSKNSRRWRSSRARACRS